MKDVEKQRAAWRRWYERNREKNIAQSKIKVAEKRLAVRKYISDLKEVSSCVRCGFSHPATLQFHHRDKADKLGTIADICALNWSLEKLRAEIAKCDILCANCHAIEHYQG